MSNKHAPTPVGVIETPSSESFGEAQSRETLRLSRMSRTLSRVSLTSLLLVASVVGPRAAHAQAEAAPPEATSEASNAAGTPDASEATAQPPAADSAPSAPPSNATASNASTAAVGEGTAAAAPPPPPAEARSKDVAPADGAPGKEAGPAEAPAEAGGKKKKKHGVKVDGRVVGRAELVQKQTTTINSEGLLEDTEQESLDLLVRQARLGVEYQSPLPWLSAEVSVDASSSRVRARNAYVQAKGKGYLARLGRFRAPIGAFETTSSWQLPTADRGLLNDLIVDRLQVGGRRPGVLLGATLPFGIKPKILVAAFQGSQLVDPSTFDTDLIEERSLDVQSQLARVEAEAGVVRFGAFYQRRVGVPRTLLPGEDPEHYWTTGADIAVDWLFETGGLRFWIDGFSGASWLEHSGKERDDDDATFLAGRAVLAVRWGGIDKEQFYVEPFARVGALDPDLTVTRDAALDAAVGVNVGYWRRARLTLQGELNRTKSNFPQGYALDFSRERKALVLQAGVGF